MNETTTPPAVPKKTNDERVWATFCHLSAFLGLLGFPLGHLLGPLVVWLIKRNEFPLVDDQGKEALNFQISWTIYVLISVVLCFVVIGFLFLMILLLMELVLVIIASVRANDGKQYRYPFTIRFLS